MTIDVRQPRQATLLRAVLDSLPARTAIVAADGKVIEANRAWEMFNGDVDPLWGEAAAIVRRVLDGLAPKVSVEYEDGGARYVLEVVALDGAAGALITHTDVTEERQQHDELVHQARHDQLTGLANRSLLAERVDEALDNCRISTGRPALLFIDLDGLKSVNDQQGHAAGDQLLIAVASRLRDAVRPTDTVARMSGDEFVILCNGIQSRTELERLVERIKAAVARAGASASVGVSMATGPEDTLTRLLREADAAMYAEKRRTH
jgi:diguanylate cyclase (GGDEF)-like protein